MEIIQPFYDATIESSPISYIHRKPSPMKSTVKPRVEEHGSIKEELIRLKDKEEVMPKKETRERLPLAPF